MKRKLLLELGTQRRWWCPDCGHVMHKPQYHADGPDGSVNRFHSSYCRSPLRDVAVTVVEADAAEETA